MSAARDFSTRAGRRRAPAGRAGRAARRPTPAAVRATPPALPTEGWRFFAPPVPGFAA